MTQAFNLAQLANRVNTSGQVDASTALTNAVPAANGGTGAANAAAARTNLGVPADDGTGATGAWGISITGNAATADSAVSLTTANWTVTQSGTDLNDLMASEWLEASRASQAPKAIAPIAARTHEIVRNSTLPWAVR